MEALLTISEGLSLNSLMNITFSGTSIAANAVSALYNFLCLREAAAKMDQRIFSLTNLQSLVAFSHFPFSQKSKRIVG